MIRHSFMRAALIFLMSLFFLLSPFSRSAMAWVTDPLPPCEWTDGGCASGEWAPAVVCPAGYGLPVGTRLYLDCNLYCKCARCSATDATPQCLTRCQAAFDTGSRWNTALYPSPEAFLNSLVHNATSGTVYPDCGGYVMVPMRYAISVPMLVLCQDGTPVDASGTCSCPDGPRVPRGSPCPEYCSKDGGVPGELLDNCEGYCRCAKCGASGSTQGCVDRCKPLLSTRTRLPTPTDPVEPLASFLSTLAGDRSDCGTTCWDGTYRTEARLCPPATTGRGVAED